MSRFKNFKTAFKADIDTEFDRWFLDKQRKNGDVFVVYSDGYTDEDETEEGKRYCPDDFNIIGFCVFSDKHKLEVEKEFMWYGIFKIFAAEELIKNK